MAFLDDAASDLEDVFLTDFAVAGVLAGRDVQVVFDAPGEIASGLSVHQAAVQIRTADVPNPYIDALLVVPHGTHFGNYVVREHVPDGTGMSLLLLTRLAGSP